MEIVQLTPQLNSLRLGGMVESLELRNRESIGRKLSYVEFLALLVQDELERRAANKLKLRLRRANFDSTKTLENFEFDFNPRINQKQIFDLATCRFIREKENVFLCGKTGVGKTHLAVALGNEACRRDFDVVFTTLAKMLTQINGGRADGTDNLRLRKYIKSDLLIIDDFGLMSLKPPGPEDLYEVINERYEKGSIIITSNRAKEEWPTLFHDPLLANAVLDRLLHHAHIIEIVGPSYRTSKKTRTKFAGNGSKKEGKDIGKTR